MSVNISNVLVKKFEREVVHKFQEEGILRDTVRVKDAKGANQVQFNLMGRGTATERDNIQTPIPVMDIDHTPRVATVKNYTASELTDIFLNNQVGFDERQELVTAIASALGRRLDQIIIDALVAETGITKAVANNISGSADNLTLAALRESALQLDLDGVGEGNRTFLMHARGLHHLTEDSNVNSNDFNMVNSPLSEGGLPAYYGFNFRKVGNRDEGGLPIDGSSDRTNFAWQKMAIGLAMNMEPTIRIDWESDKGAHRVTGMLSAGAVVVDTTGAVEITTRE